jgi:hypothetical protein
MHGGGGGRVTDAVEYFQRRDELRRAVRVVRDRSPERFRWRKAIGALTRSAGTLRGKDRMRVEEPVREIILDVPDFDLQREVVLDARRNGVDLDRGEVLPRRTVGDIRRLSYLTHTDLTQVQKHVPLPADFFASVETSAVVLVGRAYAEYHRSKARHVWLRLPDPDGPEPFQLHHRLMADHANREARLAERWAAFARSVVDADVP